MDKKTWKLIAIIRDSFVNFCFGNASSKKETQYFKTAR